jgi:hypothetical protein
VSNPLARTTDPDTSHDAAWLTAQFSESHRIRILRVLLWKGDMTAHEMEKYTGLNYVQIDRRMHELTNPKKGIALVKDSGIRRATPSGGRAIVWELI